MIACSRMCEQRNISDKNNIISASKGKVSQRFHNCWGSYSWGHLQFYILSTPWDILRCSRHFVNCIVYLVKIQMLLMRTPCHFFFHNSYNSPISYFIMWNPQQYLHCCRDWFALRRDKVEEIPVGARESEACLDEIQSIKVKFEVHIAVRRAELEFSLVGREMRQQASEFSFQGILIWTETYWRLQWIHGLGREWLLVPWSTKVVAGSKEEEKKIQVKLKLVKNKSFKK